VRRARDISRTLELVIRSQRRFGNIVSKERLESALELLRTNELKAISLLNEEGKVVAGDPLDIAAEGLIQSNVRWDNRSVTVINLVDLGSSMQREGQPNMPTIVLERPRDDNRRGDRPPFPPPDFHPPWERDGTNQFNTPRFSTNVPLASVSTNLAATNGPLAATNAASMSPPDRPGPRWFGRPPRMSEEEYKKKGLHALAIVLSTGAYRTAWVQDLWLRSIIGLFATMSVVGIGFAWRNLAESSALQIRLVRASEMNSHLREMNVAAAGLAHETRNPLNLIRGVAQIISKDPEASEHIREKSLEIMDEVDYVTVRLNEFINYSRPREVRRSPVDIASAVNDVVRSLNSDIEDKKIILDLRLEPFSANADQQMLRQILFNLLLNAVQAAEAGGRIEIVSRKREANEGYFEIRDNGPGISAEHRQDIFRPYFTTRKDGTGLGLAVVKQIVSLHGWEVEYLPNEPRGSVFRVSRIEVLAPQTS
jgi:signal transduction histidine kinase